MISGFLLSSTVIEFIIASIPLNASSLISTSFTALPIPGIIPSRSFIFPIFFICSSWVLKSSKSNWFFLIFFSSLRACSSLNCSCAFSTRLVISPIPKILWAILSGWNTSRVSIFSPLLTNFMGLSTVYLIDKAAPPRVSPSSLVKTTPVKSRRSLKVLAVFTASWPVMESTTKRISCGFTASLILLTSVIITSSTASRPAVSIMITFLFLVFAAAMAFFAIATASFVSGSLYTSTPICPPSTFNWSIAAGRYISAATSSGDKDFFVFK